MRKTTLVLAMIGLIGVSFAVVTYYRRPAGPHAVVTPASQRIAAAEGQAKVLARYRVTNEGRSDLVLGETSTTCGCTVASVEPKVLGPGQRGAIVLEGKPPHEGQTEVVIRIATNSKTTPELALRLIMVGTTSVPYTAMTSGPVQFGVVRPGQAKVPFYVETREHADQDPWVGRNLASPPGLLISGGLSDEVPLGAGVVLRRYDYTAELTKLPEAGPFTGEVTFLARGVATDPILRLPVNGIVRPPVFAVPSLLYASYTEEEEAPTLRLELDACDQAFPLEAKLASQPPELVAVKETSRRGGAVIFEVTPGKKADGTMRAELAFQTNHPQARQVQVPLTIVRRKAAPQVR